MSTTTSITKKTAALLAILFFIPAAYFFAVWTKIGYDSPDLQLDEKVNHYLGYFPHFLQSIGRIHYITIVCCLMAMYLSASAFKQHFLSVRIAMMLIVFCSFFILVYTIFQMI